MTSRKQLVLGTVAVLAVGLFAGATVGERLAHSQRTLSQAAWAEVFDTPAGLARGVDVVALAQAVSVAPGRIAVSENGEDSLPFELVQFEVLSGLEGAADYDRLTVERAGGVDLEGRSVLLDADGGRFEIGGVYLLFLKRQPGSEYYFQVNHQGRYHLDGNHFESVAPDDVVAAHFHGQSFERGIARAAEALAGRSGRSGRAGHQVK